MAGSNLLLLALVIPAILACNRASPPDPEPCVFPGRPRSALAWSLPGPPHDSALQGRVLTFPRGRPLAGAGISLKPGFHLAISDSSGFFRFPGLRRGRYLMRVQAIGFARAEDSVTHSELGLEVLATLAPNPIVDYECIRSVSPPGKVRQGSSAHPRARHLT